jgi:hypothetical protein
MRRIPRSVATTLAIKVTETCATLIATCPVVASMVSIIWEECRAVGHNTRKNVVPVHWVASTPHAITILIKRCSSDDVGVQMQLINIYRNEFSSSVVPRSITDSATRVRPATTFFFGAKIRGPCLVPCTSAFSERLAMSISTFNTTEISAVTRPVTRDKERHVLSK